ncbi:MAG TPA: metallophosphoesterase family protein [Dehalococcoidia bacterium]|nr:metallophosphoesterase family protein [Dehalococcoidia bacterium]
MRYAILADIHANLEAFLAILHDIEQREGFDIIWCLGDVVGYGPDPHACIQLLREHEHICVAGNHDWAATGRIEAFDFNVSAYQAAAWTAAQLNDSDISYLDQLPEMLTAGDFTLVHGSPRSPLLEYILSTSVAEENLKCFDTKYCLAGHSHLPCIYEETGGGIIQAQFDEEAVWPMGQHRLILNPGGAGQPRDGDPRASYAIYNSEQMLVTHYRVEYDLSITQGKMLEAGLPQILIQRLGRGC